MRTMNAACDSAARWAVENRRFGRFAISAGCYKQLREAFGLPAQLSVRCIGKVAGTKLARGGVTYRSLGSVPLCDKCLSWNIAGQSVSVLTVHGRLKGLGFTARPRDMLLLSGKRGEAKLIYRNASFYLHVACTVETPTLTEATDAIGVDIGIKAIASTSDGGYIAGGHLNALRARHRRLRKRLQAKGTRSAKRLLRKRKRKERRFATDVNHRISKAIVKSAQDTSRAIAIENLKGIRERVTASRKQRAILHSWSFSQLRQFLTYKAELAGVQIITVNPRNTSRRCSECGHTEKANRPNQSTFLCKSCRHSENADINAAKNIRDLGRAALSTSQTRRIA